jgi:disulfide bond formation protein DsbB
MSFLKDIFIVIKIEQIYPYLDFRFLCYFDILHYMKSFIHIFNVLLSIGVITYALAIVYIIVCKKKVMPMIKKYSLVAVFGISAIATICSIVYSNIVGFPPCDLCWYQRIFIYPIAFMSLYALIKKQDGALIRPYLVLLTVIGGFISLVHNIIYYVGYNPLPCSATASCTARYVFEFGFITIPLMAFMSLLLIFVVLKFSQKTQNM